MGSTARSNNNNVHYNTGNKIARLPLVSHISKFTAERLHWFFLFI